MSDLGHAPHRSSFLAGLLLGIALLFFAAATASAQSQDISFPTPVGTNEISGSITPRDIGDARLTRHFFLFAGAPGDLIFTVTSINLNGDVDLFTAGSLRPLGKISMYAGTSPTSASKTIFLRQHEQLILRVEARSPNDNQGTYSVRFEGTFQPMTAAAAPPEDGQGVSTAADTDRSDPGVRRVTSTGARIDEPEPETTARAETTTNTDSSSPAATTPSRTETPAPVEPTTRTETSGTSRARRPGGRRRIRVQPQTRRSGERSNETSRTTDAAPAVNPRLIIETTDGTRTERFMSTVRSVTIQNGQIVIVSREGGRTERISLATVLKMTIEP